MSVILKEDQNFLTKEEIDYYYNLVSDENFPWFFHLKTGVGYEEKVFNSFDVHEEDIIFVHNAYIDNSPNSPYYNDFLNLFNKFIEKNNIFVKSFIRIRLNLLISRNNQIQTGVHTDENFPHYAFLYYFNDSDGDTVFYNEFCTDINDRAPKKLTFAEKSSPVAGKGVLFNGDRFHSPTTPKKYRSRFTLNVDFL